MAKNKSISAEAVDEQLVVSKKARRRQARAASASANDPQPQSEDAMSQCALLCQERRWREATMLLRKTCIKARKEGKDDVAAGMLMALPKIEHSLRRQMAASFIVAAQHLLKKEYLLDVGE